MNYNKPAIRVTPEMMDDIKSILETGELVNGKFTKSLEEYFIKRCKVKYAIACANCTSGLIIALQVLNKDIKKVALPSFTWYSTWYAVYKNSCTGIPCDINVYTWLMDCIPDGVDAAIIVDTFGNEAPKFKTDIPVIYDAAHGFGLENLGNRGDIEVVSFSHTKCATGMQGGIILTNNESYAIIMRELVKKYAKITEVNALICLYSITNYNLNHIDNMNIIDEYLNLIKKPVYMQRIVTESNFSVFGLLFETKEIRDRIRWNLTRHDIETKVYYEPIVKGLENTDYLFEHILCLPVYKGMKDQVEHICGIINEV